MRTYQEQQRERQEAFGDAVYETYRRGGNPDMVDPDRVDDLYYKGWLVPDIAEQVAKETVAKTA